jgi:hypothetical protein
MIRKSLVAALAGGAVALGAGLASAAIPGSDGQITACYVKGNGSLRVVDAASSQCSRGEQTLVWNQQGPQGPAGPQGEKGDPGISEAFVDDPDTSYGLGNAKDGIVVKAARVSLPPGSYVADAKGYVINAGQIGTEQDARGTVVCWLYAGWLPEPSSFLDDAETSVDPWRDGQPGFASISVHGAFTVDSPDAELSFRCKSSIPTDAHVNPSLTLGGVMLTATRVGTLVQR